MSRRGEIWKELFSNAWKTSSYSTSKKKIRDAGNFEMHWEFEFFLLLIKFLYLEFSYSYNWIKNSKHIYAILKSEIGINKDITFRNISNSIDKFYNFVNLYIGLDINYFDYPIHFHLLFMLDYFFLLYGKLHAISTYIVDFIYI